LHYGVWYGVAYEGFYQPGHGGDIMPIEFSFQFVERNTFTEILAEI
jgi:hypothetical protein